MATKQSFARSIINALKGIYKAFSGHRNLQIMLICALAVVGLGIYLGLVRFEWALISICIAMVLGAELINTSIEETLDHLHPERHEKVGMAKDIAAGAVLIICMGAAIAGLYIFFPKIF